MQHAMKTTLLSLLLIAACGNASEAPRKAPDARASAFANDARCCTDGVCTLPYEGQTQCRGELQTCDSWVALEDSPAGGQAAWECRKSSPMTALAVTGGAR